MTCMDEIWKPAPNAPDYEVSSLGRVRRVTNRTSGKAGAVLRLQSLPAGYRFVVLTTASGKRQNLYVSRLICEAFHGAPPSPHHHAAHGDGDRSNNAAGNLRWATPVENAADKRRHGTHRTGEACHAARLTAAKVREVLMWAPFVSARAIARVYRVSDATVRDIIHGRTWAHLGERHEQAA